MRYVGLRCIKILIFQAQGTKQRGISTGRHEATVLLSLLYQRRETCQTPIIPTTFYFRYWSEGTSVSETDPDWIRIQIAAWIRIRIRYLDPDPAS